MLWKMSAELISDIFDPNVSVKMLKDRVNIFRKHEYNVLHVVCYCGISIKQGLDLRSILKCQLSVLQWILKHSSMSPMLQRRIIIPFFEMFWVSRFKEQRFRFGTPQIVEASLSEAKRKPEHERLVVIIKAIADSLGVPFRNRDFDW